MTSVLLLVDLQEDFLNRPGLVPDKESLVARCAALLEGWRRLGLPVFHAHTVVAKDGHDRMPHWKKADYWACVEGTPGCRPPASLAPQPGEPVFPKTMFSAFGNPKLGAALRERGNVVVLAGLFLQSCVRATALDAYAQGFEVWIASDATGSNEPVHGALSRLYLQARAAAFATGQAILTRLGAKAPSKAEGEIVPAGNIAGQWINPVDRALLEKRNPSAWDETPVQIPIASGSDVASAASESSSVQRQWSQEPVRRRLSVLASWAAILRARESEHARLIAQEIGKPVNEARRELTRAADLIDVAAKLLADQSAVEVGRNRVLARRRPLGVIGVITPWNNPIGIPIGKIAPALAFGNGAVWKPAWQAPRCAMAVVESVIEAGFPSGLVNLVMGNAEAAEHVILDANVAAVSLTGSTAAGRLAAALCADSGKPLQGELGGNNGAIVMPDCDLHRFAAAFARGAFAFAGQRCTATRRFIVHASIRARFIDAFAAATKALRIGRPDQAETELGPLISRESQARVQAIIASAKASGAELICGGAVPEGFADGCWLEPAIIACGDPANPVVQDETFGPVAVIQTARDFDEALNLLNGVPQGLVASLYTDDLALQKRFAQQATAGILRFNESVFDIDPEAPFCGWKASGIGPAEHGMWDLEFFTRPQAVYGLPRDALS